MSPGQKGSNKADEAREAEMLGDAQVPIIIQRETKNYRSDRGKFSNILYMTASLIGDLGMKITKMSANKVLYEIIVKSV